MRAAKLFHVARLRYKLVFGQQDSLALAISSLSEYIQPYPALPKTKSYDPCRAKKFLTSASVRGPFPFCAHEFSLWYSFLTQSIYVNR